jgi:hypothetical protein
MLDVFHWSPNATTETGEHVVPYLISHVEALGVPVIPVVGYDRWESPAYRLALTSLDLPADRLYCLRLDPTAIADAAEPDFFSENIEAIISDIGVPEYVVSPLKNCRAKLSAYFPFLIGSIFIHGRWLGVLYRQPLTAP